MASNGTRARDYAENPTAVDEQQALLEGDRPAQTMGSDTARAEGRSGDGAAYIVVWVAYAVFVLTTWIIVLSNDPASLGWFTFHPLFQSLSIGCFIYGVLTLQPTSQPHTKAAGLQRHQIAMIGLGVPVILLGTIAMIFQKNSHGAAHFTSTHGTLGIITVVWIVLQALMGGSTVWFGGAFWGGGMRPKLLWKYHRVSGYIVFPLLLITAFFGVAFPVALLVILFGVFSRMRPSKMPIF